MDNRTVLITGSTSGIGMGLARAFARKGYNLVLNGLEPHSAQIAREIARPYQNRHLFSPANMLDPEALRGMVQQALATFGKIDVLVNNAGIQHVAPVDAFPEERWDAIMAINLTAAFHLVKAVWPGMQANHFGRIINMASAHGLVASEYKSAYVAAKHGLVGFTKAIALEGAPLGITANAICPGYVKTPLVEKQVAAQARAHHLSEAEVVEKVILAKQAIKAYIPISAIAEMALFLASKKAATLTGATLAIDAGWSAQ